MMQQSDFQRRFIKFASIHLIDTCNERCDFCVVGSPLVDRNKVSDDKVFEFIAEMAKSGYKVLNLHGGEPTLHPKLVQIVKYAKNVGFEEIHIQTNAVLLSRVNFVVDLVEAGVTTFIVSLHHPIASGSDELVGLPGAFTKTCKGIKACLASGATVRTNIVLMKQNIGFAKEYTLLLRELGVQWVNISNLHPVNSAFYSFSSHALPIVELVGELLEYTKTLLEAEIDVSLEGFPDCIAQEFSFRSIEKLERDIPLLYHNERISNYEAFMDEGRSYVGACNSCKARSSCGGFYNEYLAFRYYREEDAELLIIR